MIMPQVKLSDDIYEKVKKIAEKSNKSIKEVVEEAIKIYLLGAEGIDKDIKAVQQKWISLQYPSSCRKCGKRLNPGDLAFWIRYTYSDGSSRSFIYCPDCYYTSFDQSLAKKFIKQKELEATIKGLKKQAEELAKQVMELQTQVDILQLKKQVQDLLHAFHDAMMSGEDQRIIEFLEKVDELLSKINEIEARLELLRGRRSGGMRRSRSVEEVEAWVGG